MNACPETTKDTTAEIVELTKELIRFASTSKQPEEITNCARFIQDWFQRHGIACTLIEHNGVPSLLATPPGGSAPLMLMAHIDVVTADKALFTPQEKDGRLYGRGAIDDKYAVAMSMVLLKNQMAAGPPPLSVLITGDEESGGVNGAQQALKQVKCDFCIALDGGSVEKVVVKEKGILRIKLVASGQAAHGARPWKGINAIEKLMDDCRAVATFFEGLEAPEHWHRTMNLSIISAGESVNQVPDRAEATFDIRYTENDDVEALLADIRAAVSGEVIVLEREPIFFGPDCAYLDRLLALAPETTTGLAHGASDARHLSRFNIPGIVWGANGNSTQHSENEHIEIESITRLYTILDRYVADLRSNPIN